MLKNIKKNPNAYSLVEVVVSTVIFMIVAVGTFSVFSMTRQMSVASDKEIEAAQQGRELLEELRAQVDARTWANFGGLTCDGSWSAWGLDFDGIPIRYRCTNLESGNLRRVDLQLNWAE